MTTVTVIPAPDYRIRGQAAAGIQPFKNAFGSKSLDSLRGNDVVKHPRQFYPRIIRAHERFAHQKSMHAIGAHQLHIFRLEYAALSYHDAPTPTPPLPRRERVNNARQ